MRFLGPPWTLLVFCGGAAVAGISLSPSTVPSLRYGGHARWQKRSMALKKRRHRDLLVNTDPRQAPRSCWVDWPDSFVDKCCSYFNGAPVTNGNCPGGVNLVECCLPSYTFDSEIDVGADLHGTHAQPYNIRFKDLLRPDLPAAAVQGDRKLAAIMVTGQLRSLLTVLEEADFELHQNPHWEIYWKYHGGTGFPNRSHLRSLGHPTPTSRGTVAENIQQNLYQRTLSAAFGELGAGFDIFMLVDTRESEGEPRVGDTRVCEPLRPSGCPRCSLLCSVVREEPLDIELDAEVKEQTYPDRVQSILFQLHAWRRINEMRRAHTRDTGTRYEWLVRLRPDVYFLVPPPTLPTLRQDVGSPVAEPVFISARPPCCSNEDMFVIGRTPIMDRYFDGLLGMNNSAMRYRLVNTWISFFQRSSDPQWIRKWGTEEYMMHWLDMHGSALVPHPEIRTNRCRRYRGCRHEGFSMP